MKKNIKRTLSAIMATAMLASCAGVVNVAANAAKDIPINHGSGVTDGTAHKHTYEAYQIFKGTVGDGAVGSIQWGDGVDAAKLIEKTFDVDFEGGYGKAFAEMSNYEANPIAGAQKFADIIASFKTDSPQMYKLSRIIEDCLYEDKAIQQINATTNTIKFPEAGYYLIKDIESSPTPDSYASTAYLMKVISAATTSIAAKADTPKIDKSIVDEDGDKVKSNTASIGDTIKYQFDTAVPQMQGYDKYYFVIYDTMDEGITYKNNLTIKLDGLVMDSSKYEVTIGNDADNDKTQNTKENLKIVFYDFIQYKDKANKKIVITYDGELNEKANIGSVGNDNTVYLQYSNDPNIDGGGNSKPGKPNEPGDGAPTGITPDKKVTTYTTELRIKKVDENGDPLNGAKFKITGDGIKSATVVTKDTFVEDTNGEYYKLTSGLYTKTAPTADTSEYYVPNKKYTITSESTTSTKNADKYYVESEVSADGFLYLKGLNQGDYTITETEAPAGYNKADSIQFTISADLTNGCVWSVNKDNIDNFEGGFVLTVENKKGTTLPSTGGIGTTIFYVGGSFLLLGAAGLFINKKRKGAKSE